MMKRTSLILLFLSGLLVAGGSLVGGYLLGVAWRNPFSLAPQNVYDDPDKSRSETRFYQEAVVIYAKNCSGCHGVSGQGSPFAPSLNNPELRSRLDDEGIYETILNGRPGTAMPSWGSRLTADQVTSLVVLIRNWDSLDEEDFAQLGKRGPGWGSMGHMPGMGRNRCSVP